MLELLSMLLGLVGILAELATGYAEVKHRPRMFKVAGLPRRSRKYNLLQILHQKL